jgi:hypothetical protein
MLSIDLLNGCPTHSSDEFDEDRAGRQRDFPVSWVLSQKIPPGDSRDKSGLFISP